LAAVPSIGRATRVEPPAAPGADAASELYERYSAQILGYCFHQLGSREEAEDAVQTTFMNAFRGLGRGIVPEAEQAWVFKIAHNVCLSRRRSSWRRGRIEAPNNMEVLQEVVPAKEKVADELIRLQDALGDMPDNQRRAILLREWQGLSYREIADELDLSQAAVETLIFRARRALASGLEEAPTEGGWKKRLRRGADIGGALAFLKAMLGGGGAAAVKVATAVALAGATVVTTAADHMQPRHDAAAKAPAAVAPPAGQDVTRAQGSAPPVSRQLVSVAFRPDAPAHSTVPPRPKTSTPPPVAAESVPTDPAPAASTSEPAPQPPPEAAPAGTQQPAQSSASGPRKPKAPKTHGTHAPPAPPADPAPPASSFKDNSGAGHRGAPPVEPQPEPAKGGAPAPSGQHENDPAPGQPGGHGKGK
jgi:RNA polymerase sigma factor (sigma-70 family)